MIITLRFRSFQWAASIIRLWYRGISRRYRRVGCHVTVNLRFVDFHHMDYQPFSSPLTLALQKFIMKSLCCVGAKLQIAIKMILLPKINQVLGLFKNPIIFNFMMVIECSGCVPWNTIVRPMASFKQTSWRLMSRTQLPKWLGAVMQVYLRLHNYWLCTFLQLEISKIMLCTMNKSFKGLVSYCGTPVVLSSRRE